ncbi:hypothetical protein E1285_43195 [Actinomadura sp. 7K507]|nr:hypothetical protein E1285_43195 [Actinomadura sp. 7K507]
MATRQRPAVPAQSVRPAGGRGGPLPINNFRYTADEPAYLLADSQAGALVYHSSVAAAVRKLKPPLLIDVDDGGSGLAPTTAECYVKAIVEAEPAQRALRSGDDITLQYTGGTTGRPKGVVTKVAPPVTSLLRTGPAAGGLLASHHGRAGGAPGRGTGRRR